MGRVDNLWARINDGPRFSLFGPDGLLGGHSGLDVRPRSDRGSFGRRRLLRLSPTSTVSCSSTGVPPSTALLRRIRPAGALSAAFLTSAFACQKSNPSSLSPSFLHFVGHLRWPDIQLRFGCIHLRRLPMFTAHPHSPAAQLRWEAAVRGFHRQVAFPSIISTSPCPSPTLFTCLSHSTLVLCRFTFVLTCHTI